MSKMISSGYMMGTIAEFFESDGFHGLVEQAVRCRQAFAVLNGCTKHSELAVQPKWARRKKGERRLTDTWDHGERI